MSQSSVLVTVGSTLFDRLIEKVDEDAFLQVLADRGYNQVTVQYGNGHYVPRPGQRLGGRLRLECYRFKPTLGEDMANAKLIISHAGAGSIMESLRGRKDLVVVVNEQLMDNHQEELAQQMERDLHSFACVPSTLSQTLASADFSSRVPLPPAQRGAVASVIQEAVGEQPL